MKVKTSELIGPALDWAVATLQNVEVDDNFEPIWFDDIGNFAPYTPSTDWAQGGPIIEQERITISTNCPHGWIAHLATRVVSRSALGPAPLIAAMRCYVANKLGEEVEVPDELLET